MADARIAVNPSTAATAIDIDNSLVGTSTTIRQRIVIGGDASSGALIDPSTAAPSSAVFALPVRLAMNSTGNTIGSVYLAGGATGYTVGSVALLAGTTGNTIGAVSLVGGTSGYMVGSVWAASTFPVSLVSAGSSINIGMVAAGSSSYPVGIVYGASSQTWNTQLSTAPNGAYLDPRDRNWTLSTAERLTIGVAGSSINIGVVPAGSSSYAVGTVYGASSQTWLTQLSTAPNGAYLDPRDRNWTLSTAERITIGVAGSSVNIGVVPAGSSSYALGQVYGSSSQTWIMQQSTAPNGAYIDPRQATIVAATSGAGLGTIISTGVGGAAIDPRSLVAGSSAFVIGQVAQSTSWSMTTRYYADSTSVTTQKYFYTTGTVPPLTTSTMQTLHVVTNYASGTDASSFNVAAGKIFRVTNWNFALFNSSGSEMWCQVALRVDAATGGATGTDTPAIFCQLQTETGTTGILTGGIGGMAPSIFSGLAIDIPSSGSFGISMVANSSVNGLVVGGFGGFEYSI